MTFPKRKNGEIARMRALCVYMRKTRGAARVFCVARRVFFFFIPIPRGSIILRCFTRHQTSPSPKKGSKKKRSRSLPKKRPKKKPTKEAKTTFADAHLHLHTHRKKIFASFKARVSRSLFARAPASPFRAFEHTKRTHRVSLSEKRERL